MTTSQTTAKLTKKQVKLSKNADNATRLITELLGADVATGTVLEFTRVWASTDYVLFFQVLHNGTAHTFTQTL